MSEISDLKFGRAESLPVDKFDDGPQEKVYKYDEPRRERCYGPSRGGLTTRIPAVIETNGLPVELDLTPGEAHDN